MIFYLVDEAPFHLLLHELRIRNFNIRQVGTCITREKAILHLKSRGVIVVANNTTTFDYASWSKLKFT